MSKKIKEEIKFEPLNPIQDLFGLQAHKFNTFSALVPSGMTKTNLEDHKFWVNVAGQMKSGDEIRALADDSSFVARLIVLYVRGSDTRIKCMSYQTLTEIVLEEYDADPEYTIKNGGHAGWYVTKKETGERVINGLKTEAEAFKRLDEYRIMLAG